MENFDERLKQYYDKLRNNPELLENIMKNSKNQKSLDIMLLPSNENELLVANASFGLMEDMLNIIESAYYGDLKRIDINDCTIFNVYVEIINLLKNHDSKGLKKLEDRINNKLTIKEIAKLIYEMMVVFAQDPEDFCEQLANKCEINLDDELSVLQFQRYMAKANEIINKGNNVDLNDFDNLTNSKTYNIVDFTNEFHKLYEDNLINKKMNLEPNN